MHLTQRLQEVLSRTAGVLLLLVITTDQVIRDGLPSGRSWVYIAGTVLLLLLVVDDGAR
jgi:uncharacterized membrane protein